jgi:hypothetical protein
MLKGGDCVDGREKVVAEFFSSRIAKSIWR